MNPMMLQQLLGLLGQEGAGAPQAPVGLLGQEIDARPQMGPGLLGQEIAAQPQVGAPQQQQPMDIEAMQRYVKAMELAQQLGGPRQQQQQQQQPPPGLNLGRGSAMPMPQPRDWMSEWLAARGELPGLHMMRGR